MRSVFFAFFFQISLSHWLSGIGIFEPSVSLKLVETNSSFTFVRSHYIASPPGERYRCAYYCVWRYGTQHTARIPFPFHARIALTCLPMLALGSVWFGSVRWCRFLRILRNVRAAMPIGVAVVLSPQFHFVWFLFFTSSFVRSEASTWTTKPTAAVSFEHRFGDTLHFYCID